MARILSRFEREDIERLDVQDRSGGTVCMVLPPMAPHGGAPDADPSRYVIVTIGNRFAKYPLEVHLYDLGPSRGVRVVGLEGVERTLAENEARPQKADRDMARRQQ